MSLASGHKLGAFEILGRLGAGGMGEVYRARDSKLKRDVAIKVLPADVAREPDRLARFQREAEVLASLNHPHIAQVYGIEENAIVMELVEGEDLSQRIARGPIPIDEALSIARQIAAGLEAAHGAGIIHRDLKPANIKVRSDGTVKILDFGLAKALEQGSGLRDQESAALANSPTITSPAMTVHGVILGTAAYMAPEQARGKIVDTRADIWAFGCVLYEMLTGRRTFKGDGVSDTITAILRDAPDWRALPAATPLTIRTLLRRCLEKDPRNRAPHIAVARLEIDDAMTPTGELMQLGLPASKRGLGYPLVASIAAACIAISAAAAWFARSPGATETRPVIRTSFPLSDLSATRFAVQRQLLAISPNSRTIAAISNGLQIRHLDQLDWTAVPNSLDATSVFASPDNQWVGYLTRSGIWKVSAAGGKPILVATMPDTANLGAEAATWAEDGRIYVTARSGLQAVSVNDGARETIAAMVDVNSLDALPARGGVLYSRGRAETNPAILLHTFDGHEDVQIGDGLSPRFLAPDLVTFVRAGTLMGARIDLEGRRLRHDPVRLVEGITTLSTNAQYDVSDDGTLVYLPATAGTGGQSTLTIRQPDGTLNKLHDAERAHSDPRLSPDATKLALHLFDQADDIWVLDTRRGALTRVTFDPREDETPVWSPDGQWLAYAGYVRDGGQDRAVFRRRADGSGAEEMLWSNPNHSHVTDWSPDGKWIVIELAHPQRRSDIVLIDTAARTATPLMETAFGESSARFSPDGKWLAYLSDESGRPEVFTQSFPSLGRKLQISTQGGGQPVWSRDGQTLYFRSDTEFASARISVSNGALHAGAPVMLFTDTFMRPQAVNHTTYEVFPNGSMLLFAPTEAAARVRPSVVAVFNWLDDALTKLPGK